MSVFTLGKEVFALALLGGILGLAQVNHAAEVTNAAAAKVNGTNTISNGTAASVVTTNAETNGIVRSAADGDKAWEEVVASLPKQNPPEEWNSRQPSNEEIRAYNESQKRALLKTIEKVGQFRKDFPSHPKATEAGSLETEAKSTAYRLGLLSPIDGPKQKSDEEMMAELGVILEKLEQRKQELFKRAMAKEKEGIQSVLQELEAGLLPLAQEFPQDPSLGRDFNSVASTKGMIMRMAVYGKPVQIKFTSLDGKEVDIEKMKGKVVLIDFWATWCMPCLMSMPHIRSAYEKYHDKGFEVLSISLDREKETLVDFIKEKKIPWPQAYNPECLLAEKYGIGPIPAVWLVDKKGIVRDQVAHYGLDKKIEKLLAE